jgi:CDP-diacylglycerol--glycerol-3-phosphate 3-phosphatidyltransferase
MMAISAAPDVPCSHPACSCGCLKTWWTIPNAITLVRTAACLAVTMTGLVSRDRQLLFIAYGIYLVGDMLDGNAARFLKQETRAGATFDIVSDRICAVPLFLAWVVIEPSAAWPVSLWLISFAGIDLILSLGFLAWPLRGVGGFEFVDRKLFLWNFTILAKSANSTVFIVALVLWPTPLPATLIALATLVVKAWSLERLVGLVPGARAVLCLRRSA